MKTNDELRQDVVEELKWEPLLREVASRVGVTADDGVVTLSGLVNTYSQKLTAEQAAQRVAGVTVVAVDLEVKISGPHMRSDIEIAKAVKDALKWNTSVQEDRIEVKVDDGWIYLDGTAEWEYQRKAAEYSVRDLLGVRGVTNRILVKSNVLEAKEIKSKISAALHRSATVDSSNIILEIHGSRVTLRGKVRSWAERKDAENAAWASPGVMIVDNKIEIDTEILV
ncbi:MAG: BON domain-containing protein [Cyclobacteriaceae bacterium]